MSKLAYDFCKLTGVAAFITPYVQSFQVEEDAMVWFAVAFVVFLLIGIVMGHLALLKEKTETEAKKRPEYANLVSPAPQRHKKRRPSHSK